ncbi:MAG: histidine kinase dimerization/phospho-acceptor domain-containing protein, partial [Bacteroidota bacterium]
MQPFYKYLFQKGNSQSYLLWGLLWGIFVLLVFFLSGFSWSSLAICLLGSLPFAKLIHSQFQSQSAHTPLRFSLLNEIQADVVVLDNKGKIVFVNDFAVPKHINRELPIGKSLLEYGQAVGRPLIVSQMREEAIRIAIESGKEFEWEESVEDKDKVRDYIRRITPIYENDRLSNLIVYGLEISDRKTAEKEAERRAAIQRTINYFSTSLFKLNSEEDILWDIAKNCIRELEFVDAVIYTLDRERQVLVQRAAYGNKEEGEFAIYEPIEIPFGKGIVGNVALSGQAELISDTSQDDRYILDDEARLSELAVPITGPNGVLGVIDSEHPERNFFTDEHLSILTIIANIAANKIVRARVVEALEQAKEKAEKATQAKSSFLSSMSHEIRTPLNAVIGLSHLLNDEVAEPQHKESLRTLLSSAEHLLALINDILDFSKIEEGKLLLNKTSFALTPLLDELVNPFRFLAEEKRLKFMVQKPTQKIPKLLGDDTRLKQILTNLIGNALKFTTHLSSK